MLCVDEDGCQGAAPCNSIAQAVPNSCRDVEAPGVGFRCECNEGFRWDAAIYACVGEQVQRAKHMLRCVYPYAAVCQQPKKLNATVL